MATQTTDTGGSSPLLPLLVAKFGLGAALQIMRLIDPQSSGLQKGLGATSLAGQAAKTAGALGGSDTWGRIGGGLGVLGNAAGTGLGIYDTATNPRLSTMQKAGHGAGQYANFIASSTVPYYGAGVLTKAIVDQLQQSGSPTVRTIGKGFAYPARPVEGFLSVIGGDKSPKAAGNAMIQQMRDTPGLGKIASPVLDLLGLGTKPTTGTDYRSGLQNIFGKVGLDGKFNRADKNLYNAPKSGAVSPEALALGTYLGSFAPGFNKNKDAYSNQAANILTNLYGNNTTKMLQDTAKKAQLNPAEMMARFQSLGLSKDVLNRLSQGDSVLFGSKNR